MPDIRLFPLLLLVRVQLPLQRGLPSPPLALHCFIFPLALVAVYSILSFLCLLCPILEGEPFKK